MEIAFQVKMDRDTKSMLDELAARSERSRSGVLRFLIRQEADHVLRPVTGQSEQREMSPAPG